MYKYGKKLFRGADAFLLKHGDDHYIYCTTENDLPAFTKEYPFYETYKNGMDGIEVHTSKDLVNWTNLGLCLKKGDDVFGSRGFWAPEVSYYKGRFYMVYTADEHVAIAVSDSPTGPFLKTTDGCLISEASIDGHLFFDDDGTVYLYYVAFDNDNHICVARLSEDLTRVEKFYDNILIKAEDAWETIDSKVAEGPFVLKHKGIYYLTYSANHTRSKDYAVGYATSASPTGGFRKFSGNPILHRFDDIVGTGHHSFMPCGKDRYICIYHCHGGDISGFKPRMLCLSEAVFEETENGEDVLTIKQ